MDRLIANPARARAELGWEPTVSFRELVRMMVDADVELVARDETPRHDLGQDRAHDRPDAKPSGRAVVPVSDSVAASSLAG